MSKGKELLYLDEEDLAKLLIEKIRAEKEIELKPTPMCKPELNFSDMILIRTCIELVQDYLIPELQTRAKLIIEKLLEAERKVKGE